MSRLECLGTSFASSKKQAAAGVTSGPAETHTPKDKVEKKTVSDKPRRSLPVRAAPRSVQVSCQETQKSGLSSGGVMDTDERSPKESISTTPRVDEHTQLTAAPDEELKMKDLRKTPGSALTGGATRCPPPAESLSASGEEEQTEEEDADDEDIKAPVQLIMEFLRAVMDRDFQLASKLCQMILIYEPDNPEASEFLPLIHKKLLEEQEAEQSTEEDEDDDDDDDSDSGSDEESSQSSSCSSSCSSSSPSDEDEEEKQVSRHKPCPPSHVAP